MTEEWKRPGSREAEEDGCTCPVMDNCRGRGYMGDGEKYGWVTNAMCPLHGMVAEEIE